MSAKDNLLTELKDISGFDEISNWPPAPIWWVAAAIMSIVILSMIVIAIRRAIYRFSWRYDAFQMLDKLEKRLLDSSVIPDPDPESNNNDQIRSHPSMSRLRHDSVQDSKNILQELGELAKRIAMQKYSREECATLSGEKWLVWLERHDPKRFDWQTHGKIMIQAVYAPSDVDSTKVSETKQLIHALKEWVRR